MIEVRDLIKVYRGRRGTRALDGVSFTVPKGEVFGFLGPNGAGKTTTIRILTTVLQPTAGIVRINDHDIQAEPTAVREQIGLMPDEVAFYPMLSGVDHLLYYASFYEMTKDEARTRASEMLERVSLYDVRNRKVKTYSHGMKRRLALAQCLMHDPDILIMDEPAGGLDPNGLRYFRGLIQSLAKQGKTIFLSSHMLNEVEQLCTRVAIINTGRIVTEDSISNLRMQLAAQQSSVLHVTASGIPDEAVAAVASMPGVTSVERTASGLDVFVKQGAEVSSEVSKSLVVSGALLHELRLERGSLEDLFVSLTEASR